MSVKRLMVVDEFHKALSKRLKELFRQLDHAPRENYKDIVTSLDYCHGHIKELLARARVYQKRDMEASKK